MIAEDPLGELAQTFRQLMLEVLRAAPYVMLSIAVVIISLLLIRLINNVIRRISKIVHLDEFMRELVPGGLRISVTSITIILVDIGIILIALLTAARISYLIAPSIAPELVSFISKLGSVAILLVLFAIALDILSKLIIFERKIESLLFIIFFFLGLYIIIDLTGLSAEMKAALGWGLAIGVGLAFGIFVAWFLFGEYLEKPSKCVGRD